MLVPPTANFSVGAKYVCTDVPVTMIYKNLGAVSDTIGNSYRWSADGAIGTLTGLSPRIAFSTPGWKSITLVVSNAIGADSVTLENQVHVASTIPMATTPYGEGFEQTTFPNLNNEPELAWVIEGKFNTQTWIRNTQSYTQGRASVRINNSTGQADIIRSLISPNVSMRTMNVGQSQFLKYDIAFAPRTLNSYSDNLKIYRSTNCGATWIPMRTLSENSVPKIATINGAVSSNFSPTARQWRRDSIFINGAMPSNNYMFKFEMHSQTGGNLYLDAVRVEGAVGATAVNRTLSNQVDLFPNPSAGALTLVAPMAIGKTVQLTMLDATGRQVRRLALYIGANGQASLKPADTQALPRGLYHLHVALPQGTVQKAWVKE